MKKFDEAAAALVAQAQADLAQVCARIDALEQENQARVLRAFQQERVAARHFAPTTGYGYDDVGRDTLDKVFALAMGCEDALVRPQFASGTHAIYTALAALLLPGDTLLCATGTPYDTLEQALGLRGGAQGSLADYGVQYRQIELTPEGEVDHEALGQALGRFGPAVVYFQRSRGYAWRQSLCVAQLEQAFSLVRQAAPQALIVVDNCYGEFCEEREPTQVGADLLAGSLIKNPGGGLAPCGGYVAGRHGLVERTANRLIAPGIGREVGSYAASYLPFYQGLFLAPHVTAQSLKSAALFARVFELLGLTTLPGSQDHRTDIIQAVRFSSREALLLFCQSIQAAAPVDSFVTPEPWDMPGYAHQVVMAAGTFVQGASIELTADAPMTEPYTAYLQGALTYAHGKLAAQAAVAALARAATVRL